jgi:hypothetical protein
MHILLHKTRAWAAKFQELQNNKVLANRTEKKKKRKNKKKVVGGQHKRKRTGFIAGQAYPHAGAVEAAVRDNEQEHGMIVVVQSVQQLACIIATIRQAW